jgi:hypothetical protein
VGQLLARPNICQLVSFRFACRGFRHLQCGTYVLLTSETVHQFARCDLCYELWSDDQKRPKKRTRRARK